MASSITCGRGACRPGNLWDRDERVVRRWAEQARDLDVALHAAAFRALLSAASAIRMRHGRILGERTYLRSLATDLACNEFGAELIGRFLAPRIDAAARQAGFRRLPAQSRPVAMVTKGASASGKSTMRPLQRKLAARMNIRWNDFALISPDTWRKVLLDFGTLGSSYKYAGMLTSHEVTIIDRKLDAYLVRKGENKQSSHLLVDRFRFDSFALDSEESRQAPSRFGSLLCYFLMITPPEETVKRAWQRGLEVGRYKAVDDLLAHNVEAYTGMQRILFGRALRPNVPIHFEFLDNSVPRGEVPLTVAFGWSGEMNIIDIKRMLDLERYRKINIHALSADDVYPIDKSMSAENNVDFLVGCIRKFPHVNFADRDTGWIYAHFNAGQLRWIDPTLLAGALEDIEVRAALHAVGRGMLDRTSWPDQATAALEKARFHTIGRWADAAERPDRAVLADGIIPSAERA